MTRVLVPLAEGCEEIEAVTLIDTFRRAGWEVVAAGLSPGVVTASRGVKLVPDCTWDEIDPDSFDLLVLPGGMGGTEKLKADRRVLEAIRRFEAVDKWVGAVCAAPLVLHEAGVLANREATSHPSVRDELTNTTAVDKRVVSDRKIMTSQGAGTTLEFALAIISEIEGEASARKIAEAMVHAS